jgi:hypothetical protein
MPASHFILPAPLAGLQLPDDVLDGMMARRGNGGGTAMAVKAP